MATNQHARQRWLTASSALIFFAATTLCSDIDGHEVFAHTRPLQISSHEHGIGSHVATLGFDGVWTDTYRYTTTAPVAYQPATDLELARSRGPAIKTPDPAQRGIILVRGDSKSYVLFP